MVEGCEGGCDCGSHDRTGWSAGPWDQEPDKIEFTAHGLRCILHRNQFGAWCGYVAVEPGHPCHGMKYNDVYEVFPKIRVHGGLTYSDACRGAVCHVPGPGESDDVWWLGFDMAHYCDAAPRMMMVNKEMGFGDYIGEEVYRDAFYATDETTRLAKQLAALVS